MQDANDVDGAPSWNVVDSLILEATRRPASESRKGLVTRGFRPADARGTGQKIESVKGGFDEPVAHARGLVIEPRGVCNEIVASTPTKTDPGNHADFRRRRRAAIARTSPRIESFSESVISTGGDRSPSSKSASSASLRSRSIFTRFRTKAESVSKFPALAVARTQARSALGSSSVIGALRTGIPNNTGLLHSRRPIPPGHPFHFFATIPSAICTNTECVASLGSFSLFENTSKIADSCTVGR